VLNIQFGGRPSILQKDYIAKNISVSGVNISRRVIELAEKKGSHLVVFRELRGNFCAQYSICLEAARQSYREIALQKIFQTLA
jgi:hypothetical protein